MTTMQAQHTVTGRAIADRETIQRLLNTWLRETGNNDPRTARAELTRRFPGLPAALAGAQTPFIAELEPGVSMVTGTLTGFSRAGLHTYGAALGIWHVATGRYEPVSGPEQLAAYIVAATLAREGADADEVHAATFRKRIEDGIERSRFYAAHALSESGSELDPTDERPMLAAEQGLRFGHPFHPMAKSAQGFDEGDLFNYAPELGAGFPLVFFSAARSHIQQRFLDAEHETRAEGLLRRLAGPAADTVGPDHCLIPCHPWQADYLRKTPDSVALFEQGLLIDLGTGRAPVYPTSSVRTVWCAGVGLFLKLALNVRITNFLRVNPPEQMQRSIDAARVVRAALPGGSIDTLYILSEWGFRTVQADGLSADGAEALAASLGCLVREAPSGALTARPMVVAALLEMEPRTGFPPLSKALARAADKAGRPLNASLVADWIGCYVETFLLPALRLFAETGISLEAHVQNSMIVLDEGWPAVACVRDLEGVSIARTIGERAGLLDGLASDSPVLYETGEAWHRFKYYVVVNHLGHLIAVLGQSGPADEEALWCRVRSVLARAVLTVGEGAQAYLDDLLETTTLPAKANLLSCFRRRGERPLYVDIFNPLTNEVRA